MNLIIFKILSWAFPILLLVLIILTGTREGMKGKGWLIGSFATGLATVLLWKIPEC